MIWIMCLQCDWRGTSCGAITCAWCSSCSVITCTTCYATRTFAACPLTLLANLPSSCARPCSSCQHLNWASFTAISNPRTFSSATPNDRLSKSSILAAPASSDSGYVNLIVEQPFQTIISSLLRSLPFFFHIKKIYVMLIRTFGTFKSSWRNTEHMFKLVTAEYEY